MVFIHRPNDGFSYKTMAKHVTRKSHRDWWAIEHKHKCTRNTPVKVLTARKSRHRKIDDETPYKKLVDPWSYC